MGICNSITGSEISQLLVDLDETKVRECDIAAENEHV
jgi:hypothetical protein